MRVLLLFLGVLLSSTGQSLASDYEELFFDSEDGQLDLSNWLLNHQGFLPVPITITEPALGYGGGLAGLYFHPREEGSTAVMPSISGLGAAKTDNGSWFVGAGHLGIWKDDSIRYTGIILNSKYNMEYYGLSENFRGDFEGGVTFEADATFLLQELMFRLGDSNLFAGVGYNLYDSENDFSVDLNLRSSGQFLDDLAPELPAINFDSKVASVNVLINYDSRTNMLTPTDGTYLRLKAMYFNEDVGSDDDFERYSILFTHHRQVNEDLVVGLLSSAKKIDGEAPFYAYPFVDLRGVKVLQYQGEETLIAEAEARWSFTPRWTAVGFAGVGKAYNDTEKGNSKNVYSKGVGLRYLIASKLGLQMGFDIAKGPDDTAFYIQVGSAWAIR